MDQAFYADLCGGGNRFLMKPAVAVVSARRAGTIATWDQINKYFALMQMPIIFSRYWNIVHGATAEQVKKDEEGMQTMRILGQNMAFFLKCKEAGLKASIPMSGAGIRNIHKLYSRIISNINPNPYNI